MKHLIILAMICLSTFQVSAWTTKKGAAKTKAPEMKAKIEAIELIEGAPKDRKFQKIQPAWVTSWNMKETIRKAKKEAVKLQADAIIDVTVGNGESSAGGLNQVLGWYGSQTQPVLKGWFVKWVD